MHSILFVGGLGDVLNAIFETDSYTCLDDLTDRSLEVVVVEVNPHVGEIFLHHPKKEFFKLSRMGLDEFPLDETWRVRNGIAPFRSSYTQRRSDVVFYPSASDVDVLASLPERYACVALSAGHPERSFHPKFADVIADACKTVGIAAVYIGRNYRITSGLCFGTHVESGRPAGGIDLVDRLSVPGSLVCVERAKVVFTSFSSTMLMAQYRRKPVLTIYPDKLHDAFFRSVDNNRFSKMCGQSGAVELPESSTTKEAVLKFLEGAGL